MNVDVLWGILVVGNGSVVVGVVTLKDEDEDEEELLVDDILVVVVTETEEVEDDVVCEVEVVNGVDELVVRGVLLDVVWAGIDLVVLSN